MSQKVLCGLAALGLAMFASSHLFAQTTDTNARLVACRAIGDVALRAACYDRIVNGLNSGGAAPPTAPAPIPAAAPTRPAAPAPVAPTSRFGADDLPLPKRDPEAAKLSDQMIAKATSIKTDGMGLVTVTLDNGQTWRQTEGPALRVLPGAEVKIRPGLMGSYLMSLTLGNRSVRAKRIN